MSMNGEGENIERDDIQLDGENGGSGLVLHADSGIVVRSAVDELIMETKNMSSEQRVAYLKSIAQDDPTLVKDYFRRREEMRLAEEQARAQIIDRAFNSARAIIDEKMARSLTRIGVLATSYVEEERKKASGE